MSTKSGEFIWLSPQDDPMFLLNPLRELIPAESIDKLCMAHLTQSIQQSPVDPLNAVRHAFIVALSSSDVTGTNP